MSRQRTEAKIKDLISATSLVTSFLGGIEKAAQKNVASELDVYKLMNGSGHLSFDQMVKLSMRQHHIEPILDIKPPEGGRIYEVMVTVDRRRKWRKAVRAGAPDTWRWWPVRSEAFRLRFSNNGRFYRQRLVLASFGDVSSEGIKKITNWVGENKLEFADSYECLAVGEHEPLLNEVLGLEKLWLYCREEDIVRNWRQSLLLKYEKEERCAWAYYPSQINELSSGAWFPFKPIKPAKVS